MAFGQHGVVARRHTANSYLEPIHSIIGLGQIDDVLQQSIAVASCNGPMVLQSYAGALAYSEANGIAGIALPELYVGE